MSTKTLKKHNLTFFLRDWQDEAIFFEIFKSNSYDILKEDISKGDWLVIDIWAHIWLFSIFVHYLNSRLKIYSFEPELDNFKLLKKNIIENNINCEMFNCAIKSQQWKEFICLSKKAQNHSFHSLFFDSGKTQLVNSNTLWAFISQKWIWKIKLLKLDCEWSEFEILFNLDKKYLTNIASILIEFHEHSWFSLLSLIAFLEANWFIIIKSDRSEYNCKIWIIYAKNFN